MFIGIVSTNAASAKLTSTGTSRIYYKNGSAYSYYNKKIGGEVAYCIQLNKKIPGKGYGYTASGADRYKKDSFVEAQIIKIGKSKYSGKTEYMNIQYALNCYKKYNGYYSGACSNSAVKSLISSAKTQVNTYNYVSGQNTSKLPTITLSPEGGNTSGNRRMTASGTKNTYVSKKINLSGLVNKYGGESYSTEASYKVTATASAQGATAYICPSTTYNSTNCATTKTITGKTTDSFYLVVLNGGVNGGSAKISVSGSNSSTYPASYLWKPSSTKYQRMVTYTTVKINRTASTSIMLEYSATTKYSASLVKLDENGEELSGASLRLYTSTNAAGTEGKKTICEITGTATSCSKNNIDANDTTYGYKTGNYLCYEEISAPTGYKKINSTCSPNPINLEKSQTIYYKGENTISKEEYDKYNGAKKYCISAPAGETLDSITNEYINNTIQSEINNPESTILTEGVCQDETIEPIEEGEEGGEELPPATIAKTTICITGDKQYDENTAYCENEDALSVFDETKGSYSLTVTNALNSISISKKSITNKEEVPGAELSIYTTDAKGMCTNTLATAIGFNYTTNTIIVEENKDEENKDESSNATDTENKNEDEEMDENEDTESKIEETDEVYDPAKNGLKWTSASSPAIISGLKPGTYCLKEEVAPKGYKKVTSTVKFSIDEEGTTKLLENVGEKVSNIETDENHKTTISIFNEITELTVSKTDIATSKELPGATLSICEAAKTDDGKSYELVVSNVGDCSVVTLADGKPATWVSTKEPHIIKGLAAGTYYLVENIAPTNYATAESILFTVAEDGSLLDANGKSLKNNKITMKDQLIKDAKTGDLPMIFIVVITLAGLVTGISCYYHTRKKYN